MLLLVLACAHRPAAADDDYEALVRQGEQAAQARDIPAAEAAFAQAAALRPEGIEAAYGLAAMDAFACWGRGERCEACVSRFDAVIARQPVRHSHYNRGTCHLTLGQTAEARADLDAAIAANPRDPDYLVTRGTLLMSLGEAEAACADLRALRALGVSGPVPPLAACEDQTRSTSAEPKSP